MSVGKLRKKVSHPSLITLKKRTSRERSGCKFAVENEHRNISERKGHDGHREDRKSSLPFCEERVVEGEMRVTKFSERTNFDL